MLRRRFLSSLTVLALLFGLSSCNAPAPSWVVVVDGNGGVSVRGLCSGKIREVGVARVTGRPQVDDSDYIWQATAKSGSDQQQSVRLFVSSPYYNSTAPIERQDIGYPFDVIVMSESIRISEDSTTPAILWNGKVYSVDDLPKIEAEYAKTVSRTRSCG